MPPEALLNFQQGYYTLPETGEQQHKQYHLTRDGFTLLAMGFTGKKALAFKLAYIDAFNRMERELYDKPVPLPHLITPDQAGELSALIAERFPEGRHRPYAWSRFNNHFRIARYRELPASRFEEACAYRLANRRTAALSPGVRLNDGLGGGNEKEKKWNKRKQCRLPRDCAI